MSDETKQAEQAQSETQHVTLFLTPKTEKRTVSRRLSEKARLEAGEELARVTTDFFALDEAHKEAAKEHKAAMDAIKARQKELSNKFRFGEETVQVDCIWYYYPAEERARLIEVDTGVVVIARPWTESERETWLAQEAARRQQDLPIAGLLPAPQAPIVPASVEVIGQLPPPDSEAPIDAEFEEISPEDASGEPPPEPPTKKPRKK
jgi:hypothetical protein